MTVKSRTCFTIICDLCGGTDAEPGDFIPHFDPPEDAADNAGGFASSWTHWKEIDWCPECNPPCICLDFFGDHEYGEDVCSECGCDEFQLPELGGSS